jgi:hypothetical protein
MEEEKSVQRRGSDKARKEKSVERKSERTISPVRMEKEIGKRLLSSVDVILASGI